MSEINHTTEIGLIVEIGCEAIVGILKTRDMREGLKTIIKTGTARIIIEIVTKTKRSTKTKTDTEMTAMTEIEAGLEKEVTCLRQGKMTSQRLKKSTKSYDS